MTIEEFKLLLQSELNEVYEAVPASKEGGINEITTNLRYQSEAIRKIKTEIKPKILTRSKNLCEENGDIPEYIQEQLDLTITKIIKK